MTKSRDPGPSRGQLDVGDLRCEGLLSPRLVETRSPRFSWRMRSSARGALQQAYQLRIREVKTRAGGSSTFLETPRIERPDSQWVQIEGLNVSPQSRYEWQVRLWDEQGRDSGWSEPATFETGLQGREWRGEWISDGRKVAVGDAPPARYFRGRFAAKGSPRRGTLYLSAFGVVEPWLNGKRVTEDCFIPGWPDYRKRVFYVSYDVSTLIQDGDNVLGLVLGEGWYSSTLLFDHQYGPTPMVSAWLELVDAGATPRIVKTDTTWEWSGGPIRANGLYYGETFDARWKNPLSPAAGAQFGGWQPVTVERKPDGAIDARHSPPVRVVEERLPVEVRATDRGSQVFDMGQNMVGWVRLKVQADAGEVVTLRFAEMLEPDGALHLANLRSAEATARYIARGEGIETWEPAFTFFGFRYVEVSGVGHLRPDAMVGVVVHTDLPRIGEFECSNPLLNRLYANTLWGQKGNFLELPTDCPQRDERLGWTGDAQVFCHTALYNMEAGAFYRQWLAAVRDSFEDGPDGGFGGVAPFTGFGRGAAGWSDAGVIVPWITWLHTGDRALLSENFEYVERWVRLMQESAPDGIRISKGAWGDWLAPGFPPEAAPTPYQLIATAYYAHSTLIAARMAGVLGFADRAARHRALFETIRAAFQAAYIDEDGRITSDEQTAYLLALAFDLVSPALRSKMAGHLVGAIRRKANHLATGFIGTPLLAPVLSAEGQTELAYEVLQQTTYPGWLYSVVNGATTIWERWDSWTPEGGFNPAGMNSFNHYAYGAVVGWMYDTIAGIRLDPHHPGWQRFEIAPEPGGGLTFARASFISPYGRILSEWETVADRFELTLQIPANSSAVVTLPTDDPATIEEANDHFDLKTAVLSDRAPGGRVRLALNAGVYGFLVRTGRERSRGGPAGRADAEIR